MKLITVFAALAIYSAVAHAESPVGLTGIWQSANAEGKALHGTLHLFENGTARVSPDNKPTLKGTWTEKNGELSFSMPPFGTATVKWLMEQDGSLTLTYENGVRQRFIRTGNALPVTAQNTK